MIKIGSNKLFYIVVIFLFVISCYFHFVNLANIPSSIFRDEAAIGYNAYCIAETGADEYGYHYPILFKSFSNYHDATMVYFLAPLIKLFGLNIGVVRFPSGLFLILTSIAFFFMAFRIVHNRWIALFGAFIFSFLPWVFPVSRLMMSGYTAMLLGITLGTFFILKAFGKQSYPYTILAAFFWALAMYSHNCGRPMTAVYLIIFGISLNFLMIKRYKILLCFSSVYILFMLPLILYVYKVPESMNSRFNRISVWHDHANFLMVIKRIIVRYIDYFNPYFLFVAGDSNLRHNTGRGELFLFMLPLIILGVYRCIKYFKRNPYYRFFILAWLAYPFAAILTIDRMHSTRSLNGLPFWGIMAILGVSFLWEKRKVSKSIYYIFLVLSFSIVFEMGVYVNNYFGDYQKKLALFMLDKQIDSLNYSLKQVKNSNKTLYISNYLFPYRVNCKFKPYWYAIIAFLDKIPPRQYQRKGIPKNIVLYKGEQKLNKGILLTSNCHFIGYNKAGRAIFERNPCLVPKGAKLLKVIEIQPFQKIYIFRL